MIDEHRKDGAEIANESPLSETSDIAESAEAASPNQAGGESLQVVVAAVDREFYGLPINAVREILRVPKITWIPWTPKFIVGILNVRGEMLSVVDTRLFFRRESAAVTASSRIVVIESREFTAGLLVDAMADIFDVPMTTLQPAADNDADADVRKYITGYFHWRTRLVPLLDIKVVLQGCVVNQA